jgi:hypothetical protein
MADLATRSAAAATLRRRAALAQQKEADPRPQRGDPQIA